MAIGLGCLVALASFCVGLEKRVRLGGGNSKCVALQTSISPTVSMSSSSEG